jgi:hypothetical protein
VGAVNRRKTTPRTEIARAVDSGTRAAPTFAATALRALSIVGASSTTDSLTPERPSVTTWS